MLQKFHVRRRCFTARLSFCSVAPALRALREDRYHRVRATPLFFWRERYCSTFSAWRESFQQFENSAWYWRSLIFRLLTLPEDCCCNKSVRAPPPFRGEKSIVSTFLNKARTKVKEGHSRVLNSPWRLCQYFALFCWEKPTAQSNIWSTFPFSLVLRM